MRRTLSALSLSLLLAACTGQVSQDRPALPTAGELQAHRFCEQGETKIQGSFNDTAELVLEVCQPETGQVPAFLRLRERESRTILQQKTLRLAVQDAQIRWNLTGYVSYDNGDQKEQLEVPRR